MKKLLLLLIISIITLTASDYNDNPAWENFTNSDEILDIDGSGDYVWVLTNGGIFKIDILTNEYDFLDHSNSGLPRYDNIMMEADQNGNIWFASDKDLDIDTNDIVYHFNYLSYVNEDNWYEFDPYTQTQLKEYRLITSDKYGNIWFAGYTTTIADEVFNYIAKYNHNLKSWKFYSMEKSYHSIQSIVAARNGLLWINTQKELISFDGIKFETHKFPGSEDNRYISGMSVDNDNNLWIYFYGDSTYSYYKDGEWSNFVVDNSGNSGFKTYFLHFDINDNMWIGTNEGLYKYKGNDYTIYDKYFSDFYIDRLNNIWLLSDNKIIKFNANEWETIELINDNNIPSNEVIALALDKNKVVWCALRGHLLSYEDSKWKEHELISSEFEHIYIESIDFDSFNNAWLGTSKGLIYYNGTDYTIYNSDNSDIPFKYINSLTIDRNDKIWISNIFLGVCSFDGDNWVQYDTLNSDIADNEIWDLDIDTNNNIWLATFGSGINMFDGANWIVYNKDNSILPWNDYAKLFSDKKNNIWIPTANQLYKFDGENWSLFMEDSINEIKSDFVYRYRSIRYNSIGFDNNDDMWLSTSENLRKYSEHDTLIFNTQNSGLQSDNVSKFVIDKNNFVWIKSRHGLALYKGLATSVEQEQQANENKSITHFNYPNPFTNETIISFEINKTENVIIKIYDFQGKYITTLMNTVLPSGNHTTTLNADNFPAGVYYYTIKTTDNFETGKLSIVK